MIKTSASQKLKIVIVYLLFGIGIGGIISMILSLNKILPDTMFSMFIVVVPVTFIYVSLRMVKAFNTIAIDSNNITVSSMLGRKTAYLRSICEISFSIGGYKAYGAEYAPLLFVHIVDTANKKSKTYTLAPYNNKQIAEIINVFEKTKHF